MSRQSIGEDDSQSVQIPSSGLRVLRAMKRSATFGGAVGEVAG